MMIGLAGQAISLYSQACDSVMVFNIRKCWTIPSTLFPCCFSDLIFLALSIIIDSMIRIEDIHPILGWQKRYLTAMHVVGIDHDGLYDHVVSSHGRRRIRYYMKKNVECGLDPDEGHANLIAVMADGSRVMIPDNLEDVGPFPSYVDLGQAHPDEATRIIMAMSNEPERVNAILAFLSPSNVERIANKRHSSMSDYAYKAPPSYFVDMSRKSREYAFRFWLDVVSKEHFIDIGRALDLEVFINPDGPLTVDMVPESIISRMEQTGNDFTSGINDGHIMDDIRLKDFKGNDHLAWSIISHALSDDGTVMASPRIWELVGALAGPYSSYEESLKFNRFFDDDEDIKGMSGILDIVKFDEPVSLDWVLDMFKKGKSCSWNKPRFMGLMSREGGPIASRIRAALIEAMDKHTDWDGPTEPEFDYDEWDYKNQFMPSMYEDMYGSPEALRGAELLRDEPMVGTGSDDEPPAEGGSLSIMDLVTTVLNNNEKQGSEYEGGLHIMVFLEDVSRAHDLGISVMDLQDMIVDYSSNSGKEVYAINVFSLIHWMVNLRPEYAHLPYSFYSQLSEYQDLVLD